MKTVRKRYAGHVILTLLTITCGTIAAAQESPVRTGQQVRFALDMSQPVDLEKGLSTHAFSRPIASTEVLQLASYDEWEPNSLLDSDLVDPVVTQTITFVSRAKAWTRPSERVQPTFFVQNRLANIPSRRTVQHLEPGLKGQSRVYCLGLRVTW